MGATPLVDDAMTTATKGLPAELVSGTGYRPVPGTGKEAPRDIKALARELLVALGENPEREGLAKTPERMAKALTELTAGYRQDPEQLINGARFTERYDEMVLVKGIEFQSLCVHGKSLIATTEGARFAQDVRPGMTLMTIDPTQRRLVPTEVVAASESKHRVRYRVRFSNGRELVATGEHPIYVLGEGFVPARRVRKGMGVLAASTRQLCRPRFQPALGYSFGYALGAFASDGSLDSGRRIRLEVNERAFAELGGDTHSKTFQFPETVLHSRQTAQGFLDGYIEGDGYQAGSGHCIVSANQPFLNRLSGVLETPVGDIGNGTAKVYVSRRWCEPRKTGWGDKHGFTPTNQHKALDAHVGRVHTQTVRIEAVKQEEATLKSYTMYNFECRPRHSYLANGVLVANCEHHLLPFFGTCHVAYLPDGKIIGLSKIPRLVDCFARRLQVQERLTCQIAETLQQQLQPRGVAVVVKARHLCMMMRGVAKQNAAMMTSSMLGRFRTDPKTRSEFFALIKDRED